MLTSVAGEKAKSHTAVRTALQRGDAWRVRAGEPEGGPVGAAADGWQADKAEADHHPGGAAGQGEDLPLQQDHVLPQLVPHHPLFLWTTTLRALKACSRARLQSPPPPPTPGSPSTLQKDLDSSREMICMCHIILE